MTHGVTELVGLSELETTSAIAQLGGVGETPHTTAYISQGPALATLFAWSVSRDPVWRAGEPILQFLSSTYFHGY